MWSYEGRKFAIKELSCRTEGRERGFIRACSLLGKYGGWSLSVSRLAKREDKIIYVSPWLHSSVSLLCKGFPSNHVRPLLV